MFFFRQQKVIINNKEKHLKIIKIYWIVPWRRRWGVLGALAPRLVSKCRNFGQFYIIWAMLHQNFGQFHIFWASLRQNFGQFNIHQTVSISVKTFFSFWRSPHFGQKNRLNFSDDLFYLEVTLIWTEKPIAFRPNSISFFGQTFGAPPNSFELLRPWDSLSQWRVV